MYASAASSAEKKSQHQEMSAYYSKMVCILSNWIFSIWFKGCRKIVLQFAFALFGVQNHEDSNIFLTLKSFWFEKCSMLRTISLSFHALSMCLFRHSTNNTLTHACAHAHIHTYVQHTSAAVYRSLALEKTLVHAHVLLPER